MYIDQKFLFGPEDLKELSAIQHIFNGLVQQVLEILQSPLDMHLSDESKTYEIDVVFINFDHSFFCR